MNEHQPYIDPIEENSFSLSEAIASAKTYLREIIFKSWIMVILACLLGYYLYNSKKNQPVTYTAMYSFIVNESSAPQMSSGLGDIANNLGFGGAMLQDRLLELVKSRRIVRAALLRKVEVDGKLDYLANHFIETQGYREAWKKNDNKKLMDFRFTHDSIEHFSLVENSLMNQFHSAISKRFVTASVSPGQITYLTVVSNNEDFSYQLIDCIYKEMSNFLQSNLLENRLETYKKLKKRVDSLSGTVSGAESGLARKFDGELATVRYETQIRQQRMQKELEKNYSDYFASLSSLDAVQFSLSGSKPMLQAVDEPVLPLSADVPDAKQSLIIGVVAGIFLGLIIIVVRKFLADFIRAELEKDKKRKVAKGL